MSNNMNCELRMSEDSLLERVAAAAEERQLSGNTLTAYRRIWLKLIVDMVT